MAIIKGGSGGDNFTNGTSGADQFYTGVGGDYVQATAGNDTYSLGYSSSTSYWRWGFNDFDTLDYRYTWSNAGLTSDASLKITVDLELGTVKKYTSGGALLSTDTVTGVDAIYGTQASDTISGRNFWTFESFRGQGGNDTINGRGNEDSADYTDSTAAITVRLAAGTVTSSNGNVGTDTLREIESITGTNFNDVFDASGYSGSSTNRNSFGLDWNVFTPLAGNDTIKGNGQTIVFYGGAGGKLTVDLGLQTTSTTVVDIVTGFVDDAASTSGHTPGTLKASGVNFIIGGNYDDTLTGGGKVNTMGFPAANTLSGDTSSEQFRGGGGNDSINGKTGFDRADYRQSALMTEGVTVELAKGIVTGDPLFVGTDTLRGIESVRGTYFDDIFDARGFTLSNATTGKSLNNGDGVLSVPAGETLASRAFNEFGVVAGNDSVIGNGATRVTFESVFVAKLAGTSTIATFTSAGGGSADYGLTDGGYGSVAFTGTYGLRGSIGNDLFTGTTGFQNLQGSYGNDTLRGGDGADQLFGYNSNIESTALNKSTLYTDNDSLDGGNGNDLLRGDFGNDVLLGGAGNDTLDGGTGNDALTGGSGADRFRFAAAPGSSNRDSVKDYAVVADTIELENAIFAKLTVLGTLSASNFRASDTGLAGDAGDFVLYETDTGRLSYDADGSGPGAAVLIATLSAVGGVFPALTSADIFVT
jgi:Ca2+-binding RTX toxin-like protein